MNNLHFVVKTVEGLPCLAVVGDHYLDQLKDQVSICPKFKFNIVLHSGLQSFIAVKG